MSQLIDVHSDQIEKYRRTTPVPHPSGEDRGRLAVTLIELREGAGLSQRGLSETSGVSQGTIRDIETGTQKQPRWSTLEMLAAGVSQGLDGTEDLLRTSSARKALMNAVGPGYVTAHPPGTVLPEGFEQISDDLDWSEWPSPTATQRREIGRLLAQIQAGIATVGEEELEMIMKILRAIAARVEPLNGRTRVDKSNTGHRSSTPDADVDVP
jgi:transcriptional regulator with XRE-family HTH domain